jgi:hypothetical protein
MRQSLVASKLNRTVINRCGKNNSEQAPQNCSCRSWLARQAVNTPFGKGVDSLLGPERKSRDYVTKYAHCAPLRVDDLHAT